MLKFRQPQMEAFDVLADIQTAEKLLNSLNERLGSPLERDAASVALERMQNAITRARRDWKLTWEISLADFAMLELRYGLRFDSHPEVSPVLQRVAQAENPDQELFFFSSKVPGNVWDELQAAAASRPGVEGRLHARLLEL